MRFVEFLNESNHDSFEINGNRIHLSQDRNNITVTIENKTKDREKKILYNEAIRFLIRNENNKRVYTSYIGDDLTLEFDKDLYDFNKIKDIMEKTFKLLPEPHLRDLYVRNGGSGGTVIKLSNIETSADDLPLSKYINEFIKNHNYDGKIRPSPIRTEKGKMVLDRDKTELGLIILALLSYKKEEFDFEEYGGNPRTGNGAIADDPIKPHINPFDTDRLRHQNFKSMWNKN